MSECEELARSLAPSRPHFACMDDARAYVRRRVLGETAQVVDNIAWHLYHTANPA